MPTPVTESSEGGQRVEWSETFHAFLFRARIYLKRFWWIVIFTVASGTLLQAWRNHDVPPTYVSDAEMMVGVVISSGGSATTNVAENTLNYFATQVHLLQDERLKDEAKKDAMMQMPPGVPMPKVDSIAVPLMNTSILQLQARGGDPQFTQLYLQFLMQDFRAEKQTMRDMKLQDYGIGLTDVAKTHQDKMDELRKQRNEMVTQNNLADLDSELVAATGKLHALKDHEAELWAQLNMLRTPNLRPETAATPAVPAATAPGTISAAKENPAAPAPEIPQPGEEIPLMDTEQFKDYVQNGGNAEIVDRDLADVRLLPADVDYQHKKDSRVQKETEVQELASGGLAKLHPKLLRLQSEINTLGSDLQVRRAERVGELEQNKESIEIELVRVQEQAKAVLLQIEEYSGNKTKLDDLDKQISMEQQIYTSLEQSKLTLPGTEKLDQEMLTINKPASVAHAETENVARKISEGAFIGFAGGIVIIFLLGALDGRVMSVEDLTQRFEEQMLGVIPMQKRTNGQVELLKNNDQRQMFAESCRNIRSSLLYMDRQGQRPRVIMLTSSMPSEGKSTLSANLAITLGFASSRTLLVDADMRRGQLHKRFGLKNDMGLAEHIKDGASLDQVIQHTGSENLDFISCGQYPAQPGELLMSERFRESIQTLRQRYDFVIFDSPPILLTDDAASFATRADAVAFVVRAGYTRLRQVRASLENLHRRGVNVYGMVINFIDHREPGYYSYRYYDYYSYRPNRPTN